MAFIDYFIKIINQTKYYEYIWLFLLLPLIFIITWYISRLIIKVAIHILAALLNQKREFLVKYIIPLTSSISLIITTFLFEMLQGVFSLTKATMQHLSYVNIFISALAFMAFANSAVNTFYLIFKEGLAKQNRISAITILTLFSKIAKAFIYIIGILFIFQNWGFNVTAILATLGVGGIAVALAGQKTIENLFGGVVLFLDQPIRVGDFGKFGNIMGTVLTIGFRSTQIQTLDRTVVTIPNSILSSEKIETFAYRDKILMNQTFIIKHKLTSVQLKNLLKQLNDILAQNKKVEKTSSRARVVKIDIYGINIEIVLYVNTTDFSEFLIIQESIILDIIEVINKKSSGFASINYNHVKD